jgi:hypothetical protein
MADEATFKSTFQIYKELAAIWKDLPDVDAAAILERISGKRNANASAALLQNFAEAERVVETAANAAGSALAENEKYLNSIQGRLDQFAATFQTASAAVFDSEALKGFIGFGDGALTVVTEIVKKLGAMPALMGAVGAALSANGVQSFLSPFRLSGGGASFKLLSQTTDVAAIERYNAALKSGLPAAEAAKKTLGEASREAVKLAAGNPAKSPQVFGGKGAATKRADIPRVFSARNGAERSLPRRGAGGAQRRVDARPFAGASIRRAGNRRAYPRRRARD